MPNKVNIATGIPEDEQESSFMNATLQGAGPGIAFSIATKLDIPDEIISKGEAMVATYISQTLETAAAGAPGLHFEVQLGLSRDAKRTDKIAGHKP